METNKSRLYVLLACMSMFFANQVQAQETDDLQQLIDRVALAPMTRAASTVTEIDLSPYSEPRTTTLYVRNGANIRFVNGTLTRDKSNKEPLVEIQGESRLELALSATLKGGGSTAIVLLSGGEFAVKGGIIDGSNDEQQSTNNARKKTKSDSYTIPGGFPGVIVVVQSVAPSVDMTAESGASLIMESGTLTGSVTNSGNNLISITGGTLSNITNNGNSEIRLTGGSINYVSTSLSDVFIGGSVKINQIELLGNSRIGIVSHITEIEELAVKDVSSGETAIYGSGYTLTNSDLDVIWFMDDYKPVLKNNTIIAGEWGKQRVVEYKKPGRLAYMSSSNQEITEALLLAGKVNGSDIAMIRKLGKLKTLDLSHASIVSGGGNYFTERGPIPPGVITGQFTYYRYYTETDTISYHMFGELETLESIALPSGVRVIENEAFLNCKNLQKITYTSNLREIGGSAFNGCISLKEMDLKYNSNLVLENGVIYDKNKTKIHAALPAIVSGTYSFPSSIKEINARSFYGCTGMTSLNMEASAITKIPSSTFDGCTALGEMKLPQHVEKIEKNAFNSCIITNLILPETLTNMETGAFGYNNIKEIHCNSITTPSIYPFRPIQSLLDPFSYNDPGSFEGTDTLTCKVYVPNESIAAYKAAKGWKSFKNYIGDTTDPNSIESEDDLQKRLDEIAEEKPKEPVILTICDDGITLKNSIYVQKGCKAIITGGKITAESSVLNNDAVFHILDGANIRFSDITFALPANWPNYYNHFSITGTLTLDNTSFISDKLIIGGKCRIYGYTNLPMLYLSGWRKSTITLLSSIQYTWIIDGEWEEYDVMEPYTIVSGDNYTVTKADYSRMQFVNLPDDVEAVYNEELKVVQLKKKVNECDLQSLIDGLCDANPGSVIPVPDDGVNIGCEDATDPLQCAVDKTLDGGDENDDQIEIKTLCIGCGSALFIEPAIRIYPYSSLTIRNYNIQSDKFENQSILVRGTLTIDVNVHIYHFLRFIHIVQGGRVIWRGGHLEDVDEIVHIEGGTLEIEGDFDNGGKRFVNPEGGTLIIRKGKFKGDIENHGTLIIEGGEVTGKIENDGEFRMTGGTVDGDIWSETDIWIEGGIKVTNIHIKRGCRVHVIGKLKAKWCIHFFDIDDFDIYVPILISDDDYLLTEEDFSYIEVELPDGYRCIYYKGTIVIVRIVYDVVTIVEYLNYFGPQGTLDKPWSIVYNKTNIDINIDWHILKDYHLIFDGGQFTMNGGDIYIDDGASLWLKNIRFKGVDRHIYVYGTLFIDENVDFADIVKFIHICKGGKIRFVAKPEYTVNIIVEEEHVVTDKAVIYDIIAAWLEYLHIDLPDGYEWKYDEATHTITILFTSGINDILMGRNSDEPVYDLSGNKQTKLRKGLNIISGKKVVVSSTTK